MTVPDYGSLYDTIDALPRTSASDVRHVEWLDERAQVGVSRSPANGYELFIVGPKLRPSSARVQRITEHDVWRTDDDTRVEATRLSIPETSAGPALTALIVLEVLRGGSLTSESALRSAEGTIELALNRVDEAIRVQVGLTGELLFMQSLLHVGMSAADLLASWFGETPSSRDFVIGSAGIEVKTTTRPSSTHKISSVAQMELGTAPDNRSESEVWLLSLGLARVDKEDAGSSWTLSGLIRDVLDRFEANGGDARALESRLAAYGGGFPLHDPAWMEQHEFHFRKTFSRAYRVRTDAGSEVNVLTTELLNDLTHVDQGSVRYSVNLPERIDGDRNPVRGLAAFVELLLAR